MKKTLLILSLLIFLTSLLSCSTTNFQDLAIYDDRNEVKITKTLTKDEMLVQLSLGHFPENPEVFFHSQYYVYNEKLQSDLEVKFVTEDNQCAMFSKMLYNPYESSDKYIEDYKYNDISKTRIEELSGNIRYLVDENPENDCKLQTEAMYYDIKQTFFTFFLPSFTIESKDFDYPFSAGFDQYGHFVLTVETESFYLRVVLDKDNRIIYFERESSNDFGRLKFKYDHVEIELPNDWDEWVES